MYYDSFRVMGASAKWCRWEVKVDGKSCTTPLAASVFTKSGDNDLYPGTILGECLGVASGMHSVDVALTNSGSGADCFTGWSLDSIMHVLLEVQEVALCDVPNSNKQPGTACACASGYWGNITWDVQPTGPCTSTCGTPPPYRPMPGISYTCGARLPHCVSPMPQDYAPRSNCTCTSPQAFTLCLLCFLHLLRPRTTASTV